jgi:transcriptional regulator with XRE-family HTH domain
MSADDAEPVVRKLLPEQRVGAAMRAARESAGISLRQLAKQLGYHSHTTLSSYERGAVMPTEEAVVGYERLLRLKPGTLTAVLEGARIERHGDVWAKRRVHIPVEFMPEDANASDCGDRAATASAASNAVRKRPSLLILVGSGAVLLVLMALTVGLLIARPAPSHRASFPEHVRIGSDPVVKGCTADAVTDASVGVFDPSDRLIGLLQLRSSARCGASWGRFVPYSGLKSRPRIRLEISALRPADHTVAKFQIAYFRRITYGNMLTSLRRCVYAQLTTTHHGQRDPYTFRTPCRTAVR